MVKWPKRVYTQGNGPTWARACNECHEWPSAYLSTCLGIYPTYLLQYLCGCTEHTVDRPTSVSTSFSFPFVDVMTDGQHSTMCSGRDATYGQSLFGSCWASAGLFWKGGSIIIIIIIITRFMRVLCCQRIVLLCCSLSCSEQSQADLTHTHPCSLAPPARSRGQTIAVERLGSTSLFCLRWPSSSPCVAFRASGSLCFFLGRAKGSALRQTL